MIIGIIIGVIIGVPIFLIFLAVLTCVPIKDNIVMKEKQIYKSTGMNNNNEEWYSDNYVDEFNDKLSNRFIGYNTSGKFDNTATHNSELYVQLVIDNKDISFNLRELDTNNPFVQCEKYGIHGIAKNEREERTKFEVGDNTDELRNLLSTSKQVKFVLYDNDNSEYRFKINCEKFGYMIVTNLYNGIKT